MIKDNRFYIAIIIWLILLIIVALCIPIIITQVGMLAVACLAIMQIRWQERIKVVTPKISDAVACLNVLESEMRRCYSPLGNSSEWDEGETGIYPRSRLKALIEARDRWERAWFSIKFCMSDKVQKMARDLNNDIAKNMVDWSILKDNLVDGDEGLDLHKKCRNFVYNEMIKRIENIEKLI
jgi:hypothetical protein